MSLSRPIRTLSSICISAAIAIPAMPALAQGANQPASSGTTVVVKQAPSAAECSARADRAARDSTGVAGGAVTGGVGGAAFGAIVGGGKGAKRGAAAGAIVGGVAGGARRNDVYKRVYDDCMRGS